MWRRSPRTAPQPVQCRGHLEGVEAAVPIPSPPLASLVTATREAPHAARTRVVEAMFTLLLLLLLLRPLLILQQKRRQLAWTSNPIGSAQRSGRSGRKHPGGAAQPSHHRPPLPPLPPRRRRLLHRSPRTRPLEPVAPSATWGRLQQRQRQKRPSVGRHFTAGLAVAYTRSLPGPITITDTSTNNALPTTNTLTTASIHINQCTFTPCTRLG